MRARLRVCWVRHRLIGVGGGAFTNSMHLARRSSRVWVIESPNLLLCTSCKDRMCSTIHSILVSTTTLCVIRFYPIFCVMPCSYSIGICSRAGGAVVRWLIISKMILPTSAALRDFALWDPVELCPSEMPQEGDHSIDYFCLHHFDNHARQ